MRRLVLLLLALVLALLLASAQAEAKEKESTTPEAEGPSKSARDNDPVIQDVRALRNEAMRMNDRKAYAASIEKLREAITLMHDRVFGEGRHAVTEQAERSVDAAFYAQLLTDYGGVLIRAKQNDEAIDVLEDAVEMIKRVFGESHPSLGLSLRSLADAHLAKDNYQVALDKYKLLRKHIKLGLGVAHEAYVEVHLKIAEAYKKLGKTKKAVKALKKLLEDQGDQVNGATQGMGEVYMELATLQLKTRELDAAERAAQTARVILQMRDGESSLPHAFSLNALAGVKMAKGDVEAAYALLQDAHKIAVKLFGKSHAMVRSSQQTLEQVKLRLEDEQKRKQEHSEL